MKKIILLFTMGLAYTAVNAQYAHNLMTTGNMKKTVAASSERARVVSPELSHSSARTTSTPFWTENCGTGTSSSLPTGWTTGAMPGYTVGNWKWAGAATTGSYSIGVINSTTSANGWLVFDSDSLGASGGGSSIPSGWAQAPVQNCSSHTHVGLTFQNLYKKYNDSCFIYVSNSSATFAAGTYTRFAVLPNNTLAGNGELANPTTARINITSVAAGQATVYIRFVCEGGVAGGGYNWMVDDINLVDLDVTDPAISSSFLWMPDATAENSSVFNTPLQFLDSIYPVTLLSNYGYNAAAGVVSNSQIFKNGASVYSQSSTYASLAGAAYDSIVQFAGYKIIDTGHYVCANSTTFVGDGDLTNNHDTARFVITDTTWMQNQGNFTGSYSCYKSGSSPFCFFNGVRFDVPSNVVGDTVSGFGVAFSSTSLPTGSGKVNIQLYQAQQSSTSWSFVGATVPRAIVGGDISGTSSLVWADFRSDPSNLLILNPGWSYIAVIQMQGVTTDLSVLSTGSPNATGFCSYFGAQDTSNNDGGNNFSHASRAVGIQPIPAIRMYFGHIPLGVNDINFTNKVGDAYPNPSNTNFTVPFNLSRDAKVTVTLSNMIGQVVETKNITAIAGQTTKATFETVALPAGVYVYTVECNGLSSTGKISVIH